MPASTSKHILATVLSGEGARLFADGGPDRAFEVRATQTTSSGIQIQTYLPDCPLRLATSTTDMRHAR